MTTTDTSDAQKLAQGLDRIERTLWEIADELNVAHRLEARGHREPPPTPQR